MSNSTIDKSIASSKAIFIFQELKSIWAHLLGAIDNRHDWKIEQLGGKVLYFCPHKTKFTKVGQKDVQEKEKKTTVIELSHL